VVPGTVVPDAVLRGTVVSGTVVPGEVVPGEVVAGTVVPGPTGRVRPPAQRRPHQLDGSRRRIARRRARPGAEQGSGP
jgi:hypothetical protein